MLQIAMNQLEEIIRPRPGANSAINRMETFTAYKYQVAYRYFFYRVQGHRTMEASRRAARDTWITPSRDYRARTVRKWASEFLEFGHISDHKQGSLAKRLSVLTNEDVADDVRKFIADQKKESRNVMDVLKYVNEVAIPNAFGIQGAVGHTTLWRYMQFWGYHYRRFSKDIYYDGHERSDVVAYRQAWAKRMQEYMTKMDVYSGENVRLDNAYTMRPRILNLQYSLSFATGRNNLGATAQPGGEKACVRHT